MKLVNTWYEKRWVKLLLAVTANYVFLYVLLKIVTPRYAINDDILISMFIDGQMANKSSYILHCNYFLAEILKRLYDLCDNSYPIYNLLQYAMLYLSFTGISYILLRRCNFLVAFGAAACFLGAFGPECYIWITFTKSSSAAAISGVMLMLFSRREQTDKIEKWLTMAVGILLCLLSCMLRFESFGLMLLLIFPIGLYEMLTYIGAKGERRILREALSYLAPFLAMLALAAGLYGGNSLIWRTSPYKEYKELIFQCREVVDIRQNVKDYDLMPEVYEELNISRDACFMANDYQGFDDTAVWTTETAERIALERIQLGLNPGFGDLVKTFASCWKVFLTYGFMWGSAGILALWLFAAKHDKFKMLALAGQIIIFVGIYFWFIWLGRYLIDRIDAGMFMAISAGVLWQLGDVKLGKGRQAVCLLITLTAMVVCLNQYKTFHSKYSDNLAGDNGYSKKQIQMLIDDEHLFIVGSTALNQYIYSPLEAFPQGYRDKLYFSAGWAVRHPQVMELLAEYDVENPYKDSVNNEKVYVIPNDVERLVRYVRYYYDENARAELVEDLSAEVGINIYKLVS